MDFITLAAESDPRRFLRHLDQMLVGDDDQYDPTQTGDPASTIYAYMKGQDEQQQQQQDDSITAAGQSPLLSKTSEAELYLLATNFLLYVAMVIVTTIVAKIYFPEMLERDTSLPRARSFSYRVTTTPGRETDEFYGSDMEDDDDDDEYVDGESGDDRAELLDSQLGSEDADSGGDAYFDPPNRHKAFRTPSILEFQQESMSKSQVLRRLLFCSLMLNITFVMWGALQVSSADIIPLSRDSHVLS